MAQISNNCFDLTRLLSQFVLSAFGRHKLRQLRLAGQANVMSTLRARKNKLKTIDEIISVISAYDNETINVELKTTDKYWSGNSFQSEEFSKLITSIANREGGSVFIGINDDGSFEGNSIFEKFKSATKTGIDKFKEYIENTCRDIISPQLLVNINYYTKDNNEFVEIVIPKRDDIPFALIKRCGSEIDSRKYFISTTHGISRVSDKHLHWMFHNTKLPEINEYYVFNITTYKNLTGVPFNIGPIERVIMQPSCVFHLADYFRKIINDDCKEFNEDKNQLLMEILLYSIFETIEGTNRTVSNEEEHLPCDFSHLLIGKYVDNAGEIVNHFSNSALFPPGNTKTINSDKYKVEFIFENKYLKSVFTISFSEYSCGLNGRNPYSHIFLNMFGYEGQEILHDKYDNYVFWGNYKVDFKYPEEFDEDYNKSTDRALRIGKLIKSWWDIDNFMNEYPHYRKLYEIDMKIDQILKQENKET